MKHLFLFISILAYTGVYTQSASPFSVGIYHSTDMNFYGYYNDDKLEENVRNKISLGLTSGIDIDFNIR